MKKLVLSLFFATLAAPSFAQDFTNAKDLVKASYEKTGGDKWKSVHTMTMSSSMTIDAPTGQIFGTAKMSFKYPGYTHVKVLLDIPEEMGGTPGGMTQTQIMRPDTSLMMSDFGGTQGGPGGQGPEYPTDAIELLDRDDSSLSLEMGELDGKPMYIITATADSTSDEYFYDPESLFRVARRAHAGGMDVTVYYGDFREVDGLTIPHEQHQEMNGMKQSMKFKDFEFNPPLDDSLFDVN